MAIERHYQGLTVREAIREVLIAAEMPLPLSELTRRVRKERTPRHPSAAKPTPSGVITRVVEEGPELFFKFGPFIALREWDEPEDFRRFLDSYRDGAAQVPVGITTPQQQQQQQQV